LLGISTVLWVAVAISTLLTWKAYEPVYSTVCNTYTGDCTDSCIGIRLGSYIAGIINVVTLILYVFFDALGCFEHPGEVVCNFPCDLVDAWNGGGIWNVCVFVLDLRNLFF